MASSARIDELKKKFDESPRRYFAPLANEYRKAGDPDQAIAICREFLPQQPSHMSAHIVYGQALYDTQQFEEARTVFHTALTLDPENLIALRLLGDIECHLGDLTGARGWYQRVLDADPRNIEIASILTTLAAAPEPVVAEPPGAAEPVVAEPPGAAEPVNAEPVAAEPVAAEQGALAPLAAALELPPEPTNAPPDLVVTGATPRDMPAVEAPVAEEPPPTWEVAEEPAQHSETAAPPAAFERFTELPAFQPAAEASQPPAPSAAPSEDLLDIADFRVQPEMPALPRVSTPRESLYALGFEIERVGDGASLMPVAKPEPPMDAELAEPAVEESRPEAPELSEFTFEHFEVPAGTAPVPASEPADPFATETMAELYVSQGHTEDALRVYRMLLARSPGDAFLETKIASIEAMTALTPAIPMEAVPAPSEAEPVAEAAEPEQELESFGNADIETGMDLGMEIRWAAQGSPSEVEAAEEEIQDVPDLDASGFATPAEPMLAIAETTFEVDTAVTSEPEPSSRGGPSIRDFLGALATRAMEAPGSSAPEPEPESRREVAMEQESALAAPATPTGSHELLAAEADQPGPLMAAQSGGSIDALFRAGGVAAPDQAAAATLARAFGVEAEEPPPSMAGAPARRATEELSLDSVFRESQAPSAPQNGGFSFDRFFEGGRSGRGTPARETPAIAQGATGVEADIEQFNSWLQGLKKR